jgi:hypothetical protein
LRTLNARRRCRRCVGRQRRCGPHAHCQRQVQISAMAFSSPVCSRNVKRRARR